MHEYLRWCNSALNWGFFELLLHKYLKPNRNLQSVQSVLHPSLHCALFFRKILARNAYLPTKSEKQHFRFYPFSITLLKGRAKVLLLWIMLSLLHKGISGFSDSILNSHFERSLCFAAVQIILLRWKQAVKSQFPFWKSIPEIRSVT